MLDLPPVPLPHKSILVSPLKQLFHVLDSPHHQVMKLIALHMISEGC